MTVVAAAAAALAALALLAVALAAARRPLLARIAYRQVVRQPGHSVLMVCGMAFASGAILAMGALADGWQHSYDDQVRLGWGRVDLAVTAGGASFSPTVAARLAADPRATSRGAGVSGGLDLVGSVSDLDRGRAMGSMQLAGIDGPTMARFGAFHLRDGRLLWPAELGPGQAVLSESAAGRLRARPGDRVRVTVGTAAGQRSRLEATLAGVARAEEAGAYGLAPPSLFLPLADLQRAAGTDRLNVLRITLPGEGAAELEAAHRVAPALRWALADLPQAGGLELREVKRDDQRWNDDANAGAGFRVVLLAIGFLVVLAGVAVVVNLLLAMAEERRPRLAVLRALGLSRAGLVWTGLIEAAFYGLAGSALGLLPGLAYAVYEIAVKPPPPVEFWAGDGPPLPLAIEPPSVAFALATGLLVSLATVLVAGLRTSRMTISSAVKDLPDPVPAERPSWARWVWVAGLGLAGAAGLATPASPLRDVGGGLLLVAAAAAARGRVPERVRASLAGGALGAWGLGYLALAPPRDQGGGFVSVVVAVVLGVWGLALLVSANLVLVERLVSAGSSRLGAALRPPLAYLTRRPVRTGLATGAFGLVLAGLTVFNVLLQADHPAYATAGSGWDVLVRSAGDPAPALPASLRGRIAAESVIPTVSYVGATRDGSGDWHQAYDVFLGLSDQQLAHPPLRLTTRRSRYPSDAAVWRALRDDPTQAVTFSGSFGNGPLVVGTGRGQASFELAGGAEMPLLGTTANWLVVSERALRRLSAQGLGTLVLLRAAPGSDPGALAAGLRTRMAGQGVDVSTNREALDVEVANTTWWVTNFSDLFVVGLVVGVLSLGVLALRAVVERRRSIAVLRALGYQPPGVLAALLLEALLLTSIGVGSGVAVGLAAADAWVTGPSTIAGVPAFAVDVPRLLAPVALVYGAVLLATLLPAVRASRLPVAQALRIVD
jgi:putative ABC transport system permease protein